MAAAFQFPYLHFTAVALVLFLIPLVFIFVRLKSAFRELRRKWDPPKPYEPKFIKYNFNAAIFWLFFLIPAAALLALAFYLTRFQYIDAGVVDAGQARWEKNSVRFVDFRNETLSVPVRGSQVAAGGVFIRFPDWMRFIGLQSYHKVITFRGNSDNKYHYQPADVEWLSQYVDRFFLFLYKHRDTLTIFEPGYTESPYFTSRDTLISATARGYIVRRK